jgi:hypothetical protein
MHEPCKPIMVCGATGKGGEKAAALARKLRVPEHLLIDTGHPAGLRMIERGHFGNPSDSRTAVLIECGQHWERSSVDVAIDTLLRFLRFTNTISAAFAEQHARIVPVEHQTLIRVTEPVVARSMAFRFEQAFQGLEVIAKRGDVIARDGETLIRAPYDNTVLVMPSMAHLSVGTTMVRLGKAETL